VVGAFALLAAAFSCTDASTLIFHFRFAGSAVQLVKSYGFISLISAGCLFVCGSP
jgi:hypothetical protein